MLSRVTGKNCTFSSFHPFNIKWWAAKIGSDFKDCDVLQVTEWLFYFTYWIRAGYQSATKEPQVFTKKRGLTSVERRAQRQITSGKERAFILSREFPAFWFSLSPYHPVFSAEMEVGARELFCLKDSKKKKKKKSRRIIWVKAAL